MPKPRLPWFKIWVGATRHQKVVTLDDRSFRAWVELLDAASEQPVRGRFESLKVAAAVIRRPVSVVKRLVEAHLIDERSDGVWLHDWPDWQRWMPDESQTNDSPMPPHHQLNGTGITHETPTNNTSPRAKTEKEKKTETLDVDETGDEDPPIPSLRSGDAPPKARGNPRVQATIDAFRERGLGHVVFAKRDKGEVAGANADPGLLAEVYEAIERGDYGDDFMRKNLSVHAVVGWVNGYLASLPRAPAPPTSLSVVPSDSHANAFCQPCSDAGRRPHPPGHPGCVATAFRESA